MAPTAKPPVLTIERTGDRHEVRWRVERQSGAVIILDLGRSQSFATELEARRWSKDFVSALAEDEPPPAQ